MNLYPTRMDFCLQSHSCTRAPDLSRTWVVPRLILQFDSLMSRSPEEESRTSSVLGWSDVNIKYTQFCYWFDIVLFVYVISDAFLSTLALYMRGTVSNLNAGKQINSPNENLNDTSKYTVFRHNEQRDYIVLHSMTLVWPSSSTFGDLQIFNSFFKMYIR